MAQHSILSPSSSKRWINCPPSAMLESKIESNTSMAAEEGTAAHAFCEHKLKKALHRQSKRPISDYDNDEMQEYTDDYCSFAMEVYQKEKQLCKDTQMLIEQKVDFSNYVPNGFGTADCIIVSDNILHIIDFKYGLGVLVDATENSQLKCYSLGAISLFEPLFNFEKVTMTIFQPRRENISSWTSCVKDLKDWATNTLEPKAELALKGEGEFQTGDWCTFCKVATKCRKRAEQNLIVAQKEFKLPPLLTDDEIQEILPLLPDITKWADSIGDYALVSAINGKSWDGYKLVEGRSIRKYSDENAVVEKAKENGFTDVYKKTLISLTDMEKLMGKAKFKEILGNLIVKPQGKPTLVPNTDKRKAINTQFNEIKE